MFFISSHHRTKRRLFVAASLAAFGIFVASGPTLASTLTYPGPAPCDATLQACINASVVGDSVELAFDDLNNEALAVTDKSLTLRPAAGRTPKLKSIFVASDKQAVVFAVNGLAGIGQMTAFCGKSNLSLTVQDNVIGGGSAGLRVYDNYASADSGQRTINVIGNRFMVGGDGSDNAISITGSTSAFVANVVDNDIRLTTASTSAGIAVYTGGNPEGSMANRVVIDRNRITGTNYNAGIVLYAYGGNDNTVPAVLLDAGVVNNLVSGQSGNTGISGGIAVYSSGHNTTITARIANNTVVDGRTGIVAGVRSDLDGAAYVTVRNNIVAWNSRYGIGIDPDALTASSHNLVFGNGSGEGSPTPGTIQADPRFVDRSAQDYRIRHDSPAIDAGLDVALSPMFVFDVVGNPRRVGRIDIGAYEADPGWPTTTSLTLSSASVAVNEAVTATVTVNSLVPTMAGRSAVEFAPATVGGTVNVSSAGGSACSAVLTNGSGSCTLSHAAAGNFTVTASYAGDAQNSPSMDAANLIVYAAPGNGTTVSAPMLSQWMLGMLLAVLAVAGALAARMRA